MNARATKRPSLALIGNPNVGKTLLFNRLTGQQGRVGNYPGITVERRTASLRLPGQTTDLVDLPGTSSLSARSAEEAVALESLLGQAGVDQPDLVVLVVNAARLVPSLYLALQVAELRLPMVLVLNLIDEAGDTPPDAQAVGALFGVPCVATSARTGQGLQALRTALSEALKAPPVPTLQVDYPVAVRSAVSDVSAVLPVSVVGDDEQAAERRRALGRWALLSGGDDSSEDSELGGILGLQAVRDAVARARSDAGDLDLDQALIAARYAFLDEHAGALHKPIQRSASDRLDKVLLHPVTGLVSFLAIMLVVFQTLFAWSDPLIGLVEESFLAVGAAVAPLLPEGVVQSFVVDALIGGVGGVVVFLPQILLLFLFIGIMEDSGYMARVAFLMDRIMRGLGLHGRAFVPMLSGFACAVPAILATRTMERQRDRFLTMMVVPLMSCSARLPVYTLVIAALFAPAAADSSWPVQGLLLLAMYVFSTGIALFAAFVLGRTVLKGPRVPLVLELPPYRWPDPGSVLRMMRARSWVFLKDAGTVILACTVLMWGLLRYPELPEPPDFDQYTVEQQATFEASRIEYSAAGRLGKAIEPTIRPLGFDWKTGVGIIGAFAAREVFVSTMGVVYGVGGDVDEESLPLRERLRQATRPDGTPVYTPLVGLSLMVFFALACQCMSTLAAVKRETRGWRWPAFLFVYMTALAWVASFVVYQGGMLLGFAG